MNETFNLPNGYPPADKLELLDSFGVSESMEIAGLFDTASDLQEVLSTIREYVREDVPSYDADTLDKVARAILEVRLNDSIDRHDAPFFSDGIKSELKRRGVAVTCRDELRSSFINVFADDLNSLLRRKTIDQAASDIAEGIELDTPYRGNFAGYPEPLIGAVLRELVASGALQP